MAEFQHIKEILVRNFEYHDTHRLIYRAILTLYDKGEEVDVVTLSAQLEREGVLERAGGGTRGMTDTEKAVIELSANALKVLQRPWGTNTRSRRSGP